MVTKSYTGMGGNGYTKVSHSRTSLMYNVWSHLVQVYRLMTFLQRSSEQAYRELPRVVIWCLRRCICATVVVNVFRTGVPMASKMAQGTIGQMKVSMSAVERYCIIVLSLKFLIYLYEICTWNLLSNVKLCMMYEDVQWNLRISSLDVSTCFTSSQNRLTSIRFFFRKLPCSCSNFAQIIIV